MKYYKVITERADWFSYYVTKTNELFTQKERDTKVRYITDFWFQEVDIPKNKTKKIDGRRFEVCEI